MKPKTWGIASIIGAVLAIGLGIAYQGQSEALFAASESEISSLDVGLANGTGIGAAGALLMTLVAAWRSRSPQKIIQTVSLVCLWGTTLGNKTVSDKISELAALLNAPSPPPGPVPSPEGLKDWASNIATDILKEIKDRLGLDAAKELTKP